MASNAITAGIPGEAAVNTFEVAANEVDKGYRRDTAGEECGGGQRASPAPPLTKEAAFLRAAEDTDGGQGAMLFPEFVEALTRLCFARYGPLATQVAGVTAGNKPNTGGGGKVIFERLPWKYR